MIPRLPARALAAIFVLALAVRIAATAVVGFSEPGFGDADRYLFAADVLAREGRYPDRTDPYFFRPPAYPVFLVAVTLGTGSVAVAKTANAALGAGAAVLLAALSARIFRRRGVALATGIAAALHPSLVMLSTGVQSEPLFLVFLLLAALFLLVAADRPSSNAAVVAGILLGLAALTRSSALALAPLLVAPLADARYPARVRAHVSASALLGLALAVAPWTLRNALRFHELIPISDAGGVSLYAGNSAWTRSYYDLRSRRDYERWLERFDQDLRARLAKIEESGAVSPGRRSAAFGRMAIEEAASDPARSLRLLGLKAWHWIRPYPTPWFWPSPVVAGVGALSVLVYVLAARGFLRPIRPGVAAFCAGVLALSMLSHVVLQVVWRYRVPYWDPILLLYAVPGAWRRPDVRPAPGH